MNNEDNKLCFQLISKQLIIQNYIGNYPRYSYEDWLRELINESSYFKRLSGDKLYTKPTSEESGQCDCMSENYHLELKLLLSETICRALRLFSGTITKIGNGITLYGSPRVSPKASDYDPIQGTLYYRELSRISYEDFLKIEGKKKSSKRGRDNDMNKLKDLISVDKNALFFIPSEYSVEHCSVENELNYIVDKLEHYYEIMLRYRQERFNGQYDTYFSFIYDSSIVVLKAEQLHFMVADKILLSKSKLYKELSS